MPADPTPTALLFGEPHEEALAFIRGKPAIAREAFNKLLPELRARAFTVTGVAGFDQLQRIRESIAGIAEGATWDDAKKDIVAELDWEDVGAAERRAELLLRTHGFQSFQAAQWDVAQKDDDTTHLQYLSIEDERVRPAHAALNGVVLPKDDPFWQKHYPPWEWGCRCRVRPMNPDLVDEARADDAGQPPEDRNVIEGPALGQLREGTLLRHGQRFDMTPPSDRPGGEKAFGWSPADLRLPLDKILERYAPETAEAFTRWAGRVEIGPGQSLLSILEPNG